jgi:hypothetical protein
MAPEPCTNQPYESPSHVYPREPSVLDVKQILGKEEPLVARRAGPIISILNWQHNGRLFTNSHSFQTRQNVSRLPISEFNSPTKALGYRLGSFEHAHKVPYSDRCISRGPDFRLQYSAIETALGLREHGGQQYLASRERPRRRFCCGQNSLQ